MQQQKMQKEEVKAPIYLQPSRIAESPFVSRELFFRDGERKGKMILCFLSRARHAPSAPITGCHASKD